MRNRITIALALAFAATFAAALVACAQGSASQQRPQNRRQPQVRNQMRQPRRRPVADCIEVCRVEGVFRDSNEMRATSHLSGSTLTIKFGDETHFYTDEVVPVSELKEGDTIVVQGAPTTMIVQEMFSQEEGAVRRIAKAVTDNLSDQDKEDFEVAPFKDPPKTSVSVKGTVTKLQPLTVTTADGISIQLVVVDKSKMLRMKEAKPADVKSYQDVVIVGRRGDSDDVWTADLVYIGQPNRIVDLFIRDIIRPKAMQMPRRGG
jgi:hypothetical protein